MCYRKSESKREKRPKTIILINFFHHLQALMFSIDYNVIYEPIGNIEIIDIVVVEYLVFDDGSMAVVRLS